MKILLSGCNGRMGQAISRRLPQQHEIVAGVSRTINKKNYQYPIYQTFEEVKVAFDIVIDFSVAVNASSVIAFVSKVKKPLVMGTTGLLEEQVSQLTDLSKEVAILFSHNTSFGVTVLLHLLEMTSKLLSTDYDIELVEKHDRNKLDAPSGTSHLILDAIESGLGERRDVVHGRSPKQSKRNEKEIGIHSLRGGGIASEHYISFIGEDDTIEINHIARSFDIYGLGAIKGGEVLLSKTEGLYSMKDVLPITI